MVTGRNKGPLMRLAAKSKGSNKSSSGPEIEDTFRHLEQLSFVGDRVVASPVPEEDEQEKTKRDAAFDKAMKELNVKDIFDTPPASAESETDRYNNMATALSSASPEDDLVADLKNDLESDYLRSMKEAIDEALEESKVQCDDILKKESLLDDKEIMTEINKIFERANDQLLQGLEEIRFEQVCN
jgi:hypothetical protein